MTEKKKPRKPALRFVNEPECLAAGLNPQKVEALARDLDRVAKAAKRMGLTIFGGTNGSLRFKSPDDGIHRGPLVLANISGPFDGGDGGERMDDAGLWRGEGA